MVLFPRIWKDLDMAVYLLKNRDKCQNVECFHALFLRSIGFICLLLFRLLFIDLLLFYNNDICIKRNNNNPTKK